MTKKSYEELLSKIEEKHRIVGKYLLKMIENNHKYRIDYSSLTKSLGEKIDWHVGLPHLLGDISGLCFYLKLPMISVVVINKSEARPGNGFFKLYDMYHNTHCAGILASEIKIEEEERLNVINCKDWSKLKEVLDIV